MPNPNSDFNNSMAAFYSRPDPTLIAALQKAADDKSVLKILKFGVAQIEAHNINTQLVKRGKELISELERLLPNSVNYGEVIRLRQVIQEAETFIIDTETTAPNGN